MRYSVRKSTTNHVYYLTNKCKWQVKSSLKFNMLFRTLNCAERILKRVNTDDASSLTFVKMDKEGNMYFIDELDGGTFKKMATAIPLALDGGLRLPKA